MRIRLGQFWLQINAVDDKIHSPHLWQRNNGTLIIFSNKSNIRDNFRSPGFSGSLFILAISVYSLTREPVFNINPMYLVIVPVTKKDYFNCYYKNRLIFQE
ncbi:MAG: hypothetical protein P8X42_07560 [Calditrichaceae bacterium]